VIDSQRRKNYGWRARVWIGTAWLAAAACASPAPPPARMLEPLSRVPALPPAAVDRTAISLATAALTDDAPRAAQQLAQLRSELEHEEALLEAATKGRGQVIASESRRGALLALATDLANSTLGDERAYREASRSLIASGEADDALRARLEQAIADDPLSLARSRVVEGYEIVWAETFNAVSAPLGRSLIYGFTTAPFEIATSATQYVARWIERPDVSLQQRQALRHWDEFLARHPDADESDEIRRTADTIRDELREMQRNHFLEAADFALANGQPRLARIQAQRALSYLPVAPDKRAESKTVIDAKIASAELAVEKHRALRLLSTGAATPETFRNTTPGEAEILRALWIGETGEVSDQLRSEIDRRSRLSGSDLRRARSEIDALEYALATTQHEQGAESASWDRLGRIAERSPEESSMARHAAALLSSPWQNPASAFDRERVQGTQDAVATSVLGGYAQGPRYRALPSEVAYLIDAPRIAQTALSTPFRILLSPLTGSPNRDYKRGAAIAAYRYLERYPQGEHLREHIDWLLEYEDGRSNSIAALRLADWIPDFDRDRRAELAESAAEQQLRRASEAGRRDQRAALLRSVVQEFPDSQAGHEAGMQARLESELATPQRIRLTRGFLSENPQVAGPFGLGLEAALIDGELNNGELHPHGVTFLGGRILEFALIAESGDEDDEPETQRQRISAERLARSVALVEEAATLGVRLDTDDTQDVDASRDRYFERARLGLTNEIDSRPTAQSTYVYQGLRERYGMVRSRESILPFDLVFQGSLSDLGLGAFPRWRYPDHTPDAFLYR